MGAVMICSVRSFVRWVDVVVVGEFALVCPIIQPLRPTLRPLLRPSMVTYA